MKLLTETYRRHVYVTIIYGSCVCIYTNCIVVCSRSGGLIFSEIEGKRNKFGTGHILNYGTLKNSRKNKTTIVKRDT